MWTDAIIAAATLAVAVTAFWSIIREKKRRQERRSAIDSRISAIAYLLRRHLQSWWPNGTWPSDDVKQRMKARELIPHFDVAEERVEDLLALAPEASSDRADAVQEMAVRFYRATRFVNETATSDWAVSEYDGQGMPVRQELPREVSESFAAAFPLLLEAVEYLEEVVDDELLAAGDSLPD